MSSKGVNPSSADEAFIVAGKHVSRSIYNHYWTSRAWLPGNIRDLLRLEIEWLRLVRAPQFMDMQLRNAQVDVLIRLASGTADDIKSIGRLRTMQCLSGPGRTNKKKAPSKVVRQGAEEGEAEGEAPGDELRETEVDDVPGLDGDAASDATGDDAMEIDDDQDESEAPNTDDTPLDDTDFHDSGLPPSSPLALLNASKGMPAPLPIAAPLPTPDATPRAQFVHAPGGYDTREERRKVRELKAQLAYQAAVIQDQNRDITMWEQDEYAAKWKANC